MDSLPLTWSRNVIFNVLMPSGAAAAVTVMDMSPLAAAGTRIHPTPRQSNVPLLMLDRVAGVKVLADAADGKTGKLVLDALHRANRELGTLTLVITHNAVIADMASRVLTLSDGRVVAERTNEHRLPVGQLLW